MRRTPREQSGSAAPSAVRQIPYKLGKFLQYCIEKKNIQLLILCEINEFWQKRAQVNRPTRTFATILWELPAVLLKSPTAGPDGPGLTACRRASGTF